MRAAISRRLASTALLFVFGSMVAVSAHGTHSSLMRMADRQLAKNPDDPALWFRRALLEYEHEDWKMALSDLDAAERLAPGRFPTLWWRGRIQECQGELQKALESFNGFLKRSPEHWGGLASRARVGMKLGRIDRALDDFRAALANHPAAEPDLVIEVAQALAANGQEAEALRVLDAGVARLGSIPSLNLRILEIELEGKRYDSALSRLQGMQDAAPRPEPWMERRAGILAQAGRLVEARQAWLALVEHLKSLPPREQESHAMSLRLERAMQAISALDSQSLKKDSSETPTTRQNP